MKVTLEKEYRRRYTLEELEQARAFIASMKEYGDAPADMLASIAKNIPGIKWVSRVLSVEPLTTAKDCRVPYTEETGFFTAEVAGWLTYFTEDESGHMCERVCYLSATVWDYWNAGPDSPVKGAYMRVFDEA